MLTKRVKLKFFSNGYGISVITGSASYSNASRPFEVAVLKGTEDKYDICYDTPITNDVLGYLSSNQVATLEKEIQALPCEPQTCPACNGTGTVGFHEIYLSGWDCETCGGGGKLR